MKRVYIGVAIGLLVLSGCSSQKTSSIPTKNIDMKDSFEKTYMYDVDHEKKSKNTHTVSLEPKVASVSFYDNADKTELWTYGTGVEPLIIRANVGDELVFDVRNSLPQQTSVHRHGVRVPFDQDGVPGLTQEPIEPGGTYEYKYTVWDEGTYRFHTHINTAEQVARGLYGILIVEEEQSPWKYDTERVRALKDYRLNKDGTMNENYDVMMDYRMAGRLGNTRTINNIVSPIYTGRPGDTILLRLVNTSSARIYNLDLRNWDALVVQSDGGNIKTPYSPKILQMGIGERYTLLLTLPTDKNKLQLVDTYFPNSPSTLATIDISGDEKSNTDEEISGNTTLPDRRILQGEEPDYTVELGGVNVSGGDKFSPREQAGWTINDQRFPDDMEQMKHTNPIFSMERGKMYTVRLNNNSSRDHPMHLHGDFFQVVGVNQQKRPYAGRKDTINVPAKGYVDIAMIPTNPGTWMFHCHINEHAEFGMMATIKIE